MDPACLKYELLTRGRHRGITIVEASPAAIKTTEPTSEFGVVANHFVSESMRDYEPADADRLNSKTRYENITNWFEDASLEIGVGEIKRILADPVNGVRGLNDDSDPIETLWS